MPWYVIPVNPEPWAIGTPGISKKGGKLRPFISPNPQLVAYKQAIAGELADCEKLPPGKYGITFYFWRRLDDYETESGRRHRKHEVDATNMQKATEDALQGVLFDNDRDVKDIHSVIVYQGKEVDGLIIMNVWEWELPDTSSIPQRVLDNAYEVKMNNAIDKDAGNVWPPPEGF